MFAVLYLVAFCLLGVAADVSSFPRRDPSYPFANVLDIVKTPRTGSGSLKRRDGKYVPEDIGNEGSFYSVLATIGTPGENVYLRLGTGSGDTWVNTPSSTICKNSGCLEYSVYSPNRSSTYDYVSGNFSFVFSDNSNVTGEFVNDYMKIGNVTVDLQFGVAYKSNESVGILGLGSSTLQNATVKYKTLLNTLSDEGYIQCQAYSLWLNRLEEWTGKLVFGGVDTGKYSGKLETLQMQYPDVNSPNPYITLSSVAVSSATGNKTLSDDPLPVAVELANTFTYLSSGITDSLFEMVGANYSVKDEMAYIPCSATDRNTTLYFTFGSTTISVPMSEMVLPLNDSTTNCVFGISVANERNDTSDSGIYDDSALGESFLRSAYVVVDVQHNQLSMAQASYLDTGDNITEIGPNGVDTLFTGTAPSQTTHPHPPPTSPSPPPPSHTSSSGLSTGAKAGIGGGVALGAICAAALGFFVIWRKRRRQRQSQPMAPTTEPEMEVPKPPKYEFTAEAPQSPPLKGHRASELEAREVHSPPPSEMGSPVSA